MQIEDILKIWIIYREQNSMKLKCEAMISSN